MGVPEIKDALLLGFLLSVMMGPVFFMLIETSITRGIRAALLFNLGVALSDVVFLLITHFGGEPFLYAIKDRKETYLISGIILISYGLISHIKNLKTEKAEITTKAINRGNFLIKGFLINIVNVGSLAFWLGSYIIVAPKLIMKGLPILNFFFLSLLLYFSFDLIKIVAAKQLKKKMTPKIIYRFKQVVGLSIIIFGVVVILKGYFFNT